MQGTGEAEIADGPCLLGGHLFPDAPYGHSFILLQPSCSGMAPLFSWAGSWQSVTCLFPLSDPGGSCSCSLSFLHLATSHGDMGYIQALKQTGNTATSTPGLEKLVLMPFLLLKHIPPPTPGAPEHPPGHISYTQMPASFLWDVMTLGVHFCLALSAPVHHAVFPRSSWRIQKLMGKEESRTCFWVGVLILLCPWQIVLPYTQDAGGFRA